MKLKQSGFATIKGKLSTTLKSWLPILQSSVSELEDEFKKYQEENPFLEVKSGFEKSFNSISSLKKESKGKESLDKIETFSTYEQSLYEKLQEQITSPLFPTKKSQDIAMSIIEFIDEDGYFDGDELDLSKKLNISVDEFEKIRTRFAYLEPIGVGARDVKETFLFQLNGAEVDDETYDLIIKLINNFEDMHKFKKHKRYQEALSVIKKFKNPPALEYFKKEQEVIPDIFVDIYDGHIEVNLNDKYYPSIRIDLDTLSNYNKSQAEVKEFVKIKLKEAKDLVDALEMRKATVYKIGLMIVEHQYEFFLGGDIKPMILKDLAEDLDHNQSTISRAISNKYLECNRGVILLKDFFSTAIEEDLSNSSIKDFIKELIKDENREKPMSDEGMLALVEKKFSIKLSRRTVTKYRQQLNISSSSERKKLYKIN